MKGKRLCAGEKKNEEREKIAERQRYCRR